MQAQVGIIAQGDADSGEADEIERGSEPYAFGEGANHERTQGRYALESHNIIADDAGAILGHGVGLYVGVDGRVLHHHGEGHHHGEEECRGQIMGISQQDQGDPHHESGEQYAIAEVVAGLETRHLESANHGAKACGALEPRESRLVAVE